jgi:hypothetical protein
MKVQPEGARFVGIAQLVLDLAGWIGSPLSD